MRRQRTPTPKEILDALDTLSQSVRQNWDLYVGKTREWSSQGFPDTADNETGRTAKGDVSTPTESRALQPDEIATARNQSISHLNRLINECLALAIHIDTMVTPLPTATERTKTDGVRPHAPGAGICGACEATVAGVGNDRIRSGYCHACYQSWQRGGFAERGAFERSRKGRA